MQTIFKEGQKFTQWWLWLPLLGIVMIPIIGIYKQIIIGEPFGTKPASDGELILVFLLIMSILGLFWLMKLTTIIDAQAIKINYFPFLQKTIKWEDVKSAELVNYGFVGWGIRVGSKYGTVYNVKGNKGLAIQLKSGKKYCIGTQKEEELQQKIKFFDKSCGQ